jgi:hypothetical protein
MDPDLIPRVDIVDRLRKTKRRGSTCAEAAAEIEKLREERDEAIGQRVLAEKSNGHAVLLKLAQAENERLRAALRTLGLDLASCARIYPGAVGDSFNNASKFAMGTMAARPDQQKGTEK